MLKTMLEDLWYENKHAIIFGVIGLAIGIMFLTMGFFRTIFLLLLISVGVFLGHQMDNDENLTDILDRILPENFRK